MSEAIFEPRRQPTQASKTAETLAELRPEPATAPADVAAMATPPLQTDNKYGSTPEMNLRSEAVLLTDTLMRKAQVPRPAPFVLGTLHKIPGSQVALKQLQGRMQAQLQSDRAVPKRVDSMQRLLQRLPIAAAIFLALRETVRESMHKSYDQLQRIEELDAVGKALGTTLAALSKTMQELHTQRDKQSDDPAARQSQTVELDVGERNYAAFPGMSPDGKVALSVSPASGATDAATAPKGQEKPPSGSADPTTAIKTQMNFEALSAYIKNVQLQQQNVTHMRERCEQQFTASDSLRSGNLKALVDYIKRLHESCQSIQMNARLS